MIWVEVNQSELIEKTVQAILVGGRRLVLIKFKDQYFVTESKCPHAGADISQGWCNDDGNLVCPFHRYEYQLHNGRGKQGQGDYIKIYPTKIENHKLFVGFTKNWISRIFK